MVSLILFRCFGHLARDNGIFSLYMNSNEGTKDITVQKNPHYIKSLGIYATEALGHFDILLTYTNE